MPSSSWIPIAVALLSLVGVIVVPIYTGKRSQRLNDEQIRALEQKRMLADDDRNEQLRRRWQTTTEDVDYLWSFFQEQVTPWMREAYNIIHPERPEFPRPPILRPRAGQQDSDDNTTVTDYDR